MQTKAIMRKVRKKANQDVKGAYTHDAAYGEVMTVIHPGHKPDQAARNLLASKSRRPAWALIACHSSCFPAAGTAQHVRLR